MNNVSYFKTMAMLEDVYSSLLQYSSWGISKNDAKRLEELALKVRNQAGDIRYCVNNPDPDFM